MAAAVGAGSLARQQRVCYDVAVGFAPPAALGAILGTAGASTVSPSLLLALFVPVMLVASVSTWARAGAPGSDEARGCPEPERVQLIAAGLAVGLLTGFFGVGGGFALVPALVLLLSFPMPVAVGTSLLVIAVNSATALVARAAAGTPELDWGVVLAFTAAAVVGSLGGGQVAARLEPRHLTRAFGMLLLAVAVYTGIRSVPTLYSLY